MDVAPGWLPDPTKRHEYRYWDGNNWTDHVGDGGNQFVDPMPDESLSTSAAVENSKQWREDSIWEGERKSLAAATTGLVRARYRITEEYIYFDAGLVSSSSEQVPLWAVRDVDVRQSMTQKARGVGDVIVRVQHGDYTGRNQVSLESIEGPHTVRDLINAHAQTARLEHQRRAQTQIYQGGVQPQASFRPVPTPEASPSSTTGTVGVAAELKQLAELRDAGVLTEEEFQAQKAKLLG